MASKQAVVDRWNRDVPIGSSVTVTLDNGTKVEDKTRSEAWVLGGHTPVVHLEGRPCYMLSRCVPVREAKHVQP